jgi:hypothetical protein
VPTFAPLVGLDSLHRLILPAGYREVRIALICDLCTPLHLLRVVSGPSGLVSGAAYLILSDPTPEAGADSMERAIAADYEKYADSLRRELQCQRTRTATDPTYEYCLIGRPINWTEIAAALDSSEILIAAQDTGYRPQPWAYRRLRPEQDRRPGNPGCNDIGGQGLTLEVLEGTMYKSADFWCLEIPGPDTTEHFRIARLRERLMPWVTPPVPPSR